MKKPNDTSHLTVHKIESYEELSSILRGIAENPPRYIAIFIEPKSDRPPPTEYYWAYIKSLCFNSATMSVEVNDNIFVSTWDFDDDGYIEGLEEVVKLTEHWDGFYFFVDGEIYYPRDKRKKREPE